MEITPEIKAQLAEQKKQCVHCKLISGEMAGAKKVFEDDKTIALVDIYPAVKGHIIYMLKEHYPMPAYIPGDEFHHKFALIPALSKAVKSGMVRTGINVFMAIGGVAGQQSPHFMLHLLPREEGDGFYNFMFKKGESLSEEEAKILMHNFPMMMQNHFKRNPASWHKGEGELLDVKGKIIYEDEKVVCVFPKESSAKGHIIIYSKNEEKYVEKLSQEDSAHLFFTASLASTLVFEGLKAQGTNIILKSGESDDNPSGKLEVHIFPRWQGDSLQGLMWQPKQAGYDLDGVMKKIKDKTWQVKYEGKEVKKEVKKEEVKITKVSTGSAEDEIRNAIEGLKD